MQAYHITFILLVLFWLPPFPTWCRCDGDMVHNPIVTIELSSKGFHRELEYTVQFDYPLAGKECEYVLLQSLPAAVYVSVDQLDDLKRLNKLNAIYPEFVDVELPTEKAEPFNVLLRGTPKITERIILPIHFRYHAPSTKREFVSVDINAPPMYTNCLEHDSELDRPLEATPNDVYCLHEDKCNFSTSQELSTLENCDWKLVNVDYQFITPLRAEIPVGNSKYYPPILYATIICSWIISLWTIFRTNHVPQRINQKLEEQRILQKKAK